MVVSLFNDSKYTRWYYAIIEKARQTPTEGYVEKHHIVPRSLGGSGKKANLVKLSARQHFVCHLLLVRITSGDDQNKMWLAAHLMVTTRDVRVTSTTYERLRQHAATLYAERMKGNSIRKGQRRPLTGEKLANRLRLNALNRGAKRTDETRAKMRTARQARAGIETSAETRAKISLKTREAMAKLKAAGVKVGRTDFGQRTPEQQARLTEKLRGKKRTPEQRENMRQALLRYWEGRKAAQISPDVHA